MTIANFWQWLIDLDLTPVLWIVGIAFGGILVFAIAGLIIGSILVTVDGIRRSFRRKPRYD